MNKIFNKISELLKQEDFEYDYDHYFMKNGLHISLNKDVKKNSLYHWNFLNNDDCCDKEVMEADAELQKFDKYKKDNDFWECAEFTKNNYRNSYVMNLYNNMNVKFTLDEDGKSYGRNRPIYIKNLDALLHFTKSYIIPTIHKIETCTELLKDNYHFMHKTLEDENFGESFMGQVRSSRIEMFEETKNAQ